MKGLLPASFLSNQIELSGIGSLQVILSVYQLNYRARTLFKPDIGFTKIEGIQIFKLTILFYIVFDSTKLSVQAHYLFVCKFRKRFFWQKYWTKIVREKMSFVNSRQDSYHHIVYRERCKQNLSLYIKTDSSVVNDDIKQSIGWPVPGTGGNICRVHRPRGNIESVQ